MPRALVKVMVSMPQLAAGLSLGYGAQEPGRCHAAVVVKLASEAETRLKVGTRMGQVMYLVLVEAEMVKFQEAALH